MTIESHFIDLLTLNFSSSYLYKEVVHFFSSGLVKIISIVHVRKIKEIFEKCKQKT